MIQFKSDCSKDEFKLLKMGSNYRVELVKFDNLTDNLFLLADISQFCRDKDIKMLQFTKNGAVATSVFTIDDIDKNYLMSLASLLTHDNLIGQYDEGNEWITIRPRRQQKEIINKIIIESKQHTASWSNVQV